MNLTSDKVRIFRKDRQTKDGSTFATYSYGVNSKDKDGKWINGFRDCVFKKGVELAHKTDIKVNNAFEIASEYNGKVYTKVMITDFDVINEGEPQPKVDADGFLQIDDSMGEELPFV